MKRIVADVTKCMACRACEIACALAHSAAGGLLEAIASGARPRIFLEAAGRTAVPLQCRHCEDAPCVKVCPTGALSRAGDSAPVLADEAKCIGCAFCVQACPFGVIRLVKVETAHAGGPRRRAAIKCDLCVRRQAKGEPPACVSACPVGALSFEEADAVAAKSRARTAAEAAAGAGLPGKR